MKRLLSACAAAALAVCLLAQPVQAQDLTTQLSLFLRDLFGGTLGASTAITGIQSGDGGPTAAAYGFKLDSQTGFYRTGSGLVGYTAAGTLRLQLGNNFDVLSATGAIRMGTGAKVTFSNIAPTISSGFGTSPSIVSNNGSVAFRVNVGTGGVATSGVVGLPTATTGWNCIAVDITNNTVTRQTADTTTTSTVTAASAWAASDVLLFQCVAY